MRYLLFVLAIFSIKSESYSQLKLEDFNNFPLGIYFDHYKEVKSYFIKEPELFKGDSKTNKDNYKIEYNDIPFDIFGSADYELVFVNKTLSFVDIRLKYNCDEIDKFRQTIQYIKNTFKSDSDKNLLKEYSDLNYIDAIDFMKKEGKGVYGNMEDSVWDSLKGKHFGQEFWGINKSKQIDKKFIILSVSVDQARTTKGDWFLKPIVFDYSGSYLNLKITLTNEKLQDLRNQFENQSLYSFTGFREDKTIITLKNDNGVYKIPVKINNSLTLDFVLDLGASDVSISPDVFSVLLKTGSIEASDVLGKQSYKLADGSIVEHTVINLKSLTIGEIKLDNIKASVSDSNNSPLLLGQSALKKLGKYSIDNKKNELIIE